MKASDSPHSLARWTMYMVNLVEICLSEFSEFVLRNFSGMFGSTENMVIFAQVVSKPLECYKILKEVSKKRTFAKYCIYP